MWSCLSVEVLGKWGIVHIRTYIRMYVCVHTSVVCISDRHTLGIPLYFMCGSPYIVFILRSLYGFMLRKYIYIYNVDAAVV